jgi:hypothetical protein
VGFLGFVNLLSTFLGFFDPTHPFQALFSLLLSIFLLGFPHFLLFSSERFFPVGFWLLFVFCSFVSIFVLFSYVPFIFGEFHSLCHLVHFVSVNGLLMSLADGVVSSSKSMGYDEKTNEGEEHSEASKTQTTAKTATDEENAGAPGGLVRRMSESSIYATEEDEDDAERKLELGPQYTLKEQFEKDKVCFCMCLFLSLIK